MFLLFSKSVKEQNQNHSQKPEGCASTTHVHLYSVLQTAKTVFLCVGNLDKNTALHKGLWCGFLLCCFGGFFLHFFTFKVRSGCCVNIFQEILMWLSLDTNPNLIFLPEPEFLSLFHNHLKESGNVQLLSPVVDYASNVTMRM